MTAMANKGARIMVNDICRAYFHAKVTRDVYVQFPNEDKKLGEESMCEQVKFSMHGTRDAAQNWHHECTQQFIDNGFHQGFASPCVFNHAQKRIRAYVHGDEYVSSGILEALKWMQTRLESKYQVKTQLFGPGKEYNQQIKILNRVVTWHGHKGIAHEVDPRHVELVVEQLNLQDAQYLSTKQTLNHVPTHQSMPMKPLLKSQTANLHYTWLRHQDLLSMRSHLNNQAANLLTN